ncbi:FHA domain-containing protein [Prosthecobacter sp.]|uniref:FHA domain-containing protein n=1 Tax=Prosthecobacter sp. TaxID=1965333 RepID=UPI002AB9AA48|nr:FHA domain-containing protein [Prosthecobacter sp.]MDZ4405838.1 FHA domain-containing protein [Prosthecobacter sp.]
MAHLFFYTGDGTTIVHDLKHDATTIGRHPQSIVMLTHNSVSGHHAVIRKHGSKFDIQDLSSSNGTRVNGAQIEEASLNDGDRVGFGDVQAVFYSSNPAPVVKTQAMEWPPIVPLKKNDIAPVQPQPVTVENKDSGCYSLIGKTVVGLLLLVGLVGTMMGTRSKNDVANPSGEPVQAQATHSAFQELLQMIDNLRKTQFPSPSESVRFAILRSSEIARMPNVDAEFASLLRSYIQALVEAQKAMGAMEAEARELSAKVEVLAFIGRLYGLNRTQDQFGGDFGEAITRLGLAPAQQQELESILARHRPAFSRWQSETGVFIKHLEELRQKLKTRYPQCDFDRL